MKLVNGLTIEITLKCNSMCKYCFSESGPDYFQELPFDDIVDVIEQYHNLENKKKYENLPTTKLKTQLIITGGEFLLHSKWKEIVKYLTVNEISFDAVTNGILLNEDVIKYLNKSTINNLQVSLDGLTKEDNALRNPDCFDLIIENIERLSKSELRNRSTIKATITKSNKHVAKSMVDYGNKLGISVIFGYVQILGRGAIENDYKLSSEEIVEFNKEIVNNYKNTVLPLMFSHAPCPLDINEEPLAFRVTAQGDIYPCASFHEKFFSIGNIKDISLSDSLKSEKFYRIQKYITKRKKIMKNGVCSECYVSNLCQGSCPASSYYELGDAYIPCKRICDAAKTFNYYMLPRIYKKEVNFVERT